MITIMLLVAGMCVIFMAVFTVVAVVSLGTIFAPLVVVAAMFLLMDILVFRALWRRIRRRKA